MYGSVLNNELVAWPRASEECLQGLNISLAAVDKQNMWNICPTASGENVGINRLINFLKLDTEAANSVKAMYEYMFVANENGTAYTFPDRIKDFRGQISECYLSEKLCWGAVKSFFQLNPPEKEKVCTMLHEMQIKTLREEQREARQALCDSTAAQVKSASTSPPLACEPLTLQIEQIQADNFGVMECSEFAQSADGLELPTCDTSGGTRIIVRSLVGVFVAAIFNL